jgi:hypothetical protein
VGLQGEEVANHNLYIQSFHQSAKRLRDEQDELIWSKNDASRRYTAHLGYKAMFSKEELRGLYDGGSISESS